MAQEFGAGVAQGKRFAAGVERDLQRCRKIADASIKKKLFMFELVAVVGTCRNANEVCVRFARRIIVAARGIAGHEGLHLGMRCGWEYFYIGPADQTFSDALLCVDGGQVYALETDLVCRIVEC